MSVHGHRACTATDASSVHGHRCLDGLRLVADERMRQIIELGLTPEHDAEHQPDQQLAVAAWCYLGDLIDPHQYDPGEEPDGWPWPAGEGGCSWKPTPDDPVRQLVKAGALIAAEIDRLVAARAS